MRAPEEPHPLDLELELGGSAVDDAVAAYAWRRRALWAEHALDEIVRDERRGYAGPNTMYQSEAARVQTARLKRIARDALAWMR